MRINTDLPIPENQQTPKVAGQGSSASQPAPASISSGLDQMELSSPTATIQSLKASLAQVPEIRQSRVDALRQALSGGSYQVSDQQLSDAIGADHFGAQLQVA